jgi:peptide deformylase
MILPIIAYGSPILRKKSASVTQSYPELEKLISTLFETMYHSKGVGLAAPQVGLNIRLFVIDAAPFSDDKEYSLSERRELKQCKKVFINPIILEENGEKWKFEEGCLSIPDIRGEVERHKEVLVEYYDEKWEKQTKVFSGIAARIIQHEYDHIEGILFIDYLSSLKKKLIKGKLTDISKGNIEVAYKMKFPK